MCRLLFLTFDWNYDTAYQFNIGVEQFVKDYPDTNVYIFNGFGKYGVQDVVSGNYEIYHIPELSDYDGIALQGNRAWPVEMRMQIVEQARKLGVPVASINYPLKDSIYIGTDNYGAMQEMCEHLISHHQIHHPVYITGLRSSAEAVDREKAFLDTCHAHGIGNAPVYGGTWEKESGIEAVRTILASPDQMPDAIICANDDLAESVKEEMEAHGFHTPQDYLLTGFDNREISRAADPRITSVDRNYAGMGYTAMKTLYEEAHGIHHGTSVYSPYHLLFAGSCGCQEAHETRNELKKNFYELDHTLKDFYRMEEPLQRDLLECNNLNEVMQVLEHDFEGHTSRHSWFVMDSGYAENPAGVTGNRHYSRTAWLCACVNNRYGKPEGKDHVYAEFETHEILPQKLMEKGKTYVIYPLNSNEIAIGYYVTEGVPSTSKYNFLQLILRITATTIEDVRKKYLMADLNTRLGDLYVTDQLSGVYNRFGLVKTGAAVYRKIMAEKGNAWISFIDIDDMKGINDNLGHQYGDMAIHDAAEILKETTSGETAFIMRYGGDEFVVISENSIRSHVYETMKRYMKKRERKYPLGFSVGEYQAKDGEDLEESIRKADDRMYEEKRIRKEKAALAGKPFVR